VNTPILVLTTESGEPFKAAARAVGATGWIEKPFDPDMLTELVATLSGAEHPH
jgi:two-component system chemotaxis response regulator CheY